MRYAFIKCEDLTSAAFRGAEPVDRATWLCLLTWCYEHENGGRIVGAKAWGDRRWQQTIAVTLNEVRREAEGLWYWDGDDLVVCFYDQGYADQVRSDSRQGAAGGRATSPAKAEAARINGKRGGPKPTQQEPNAEPNAEPNGNPTHNPTREPTGTQLTQACLSVCLSGCQSIPSAAAAGVPPPRVEVGEKPPPPPDPMFDGEAPPRKIQASQDWFTWRQTHDRLFFGRSDEDGNLASWQSLFNRAGVEVMDAMYAALLPTIPIKHRIGFSAAIAWITANTVEAP
jgi:hypothetical protein